MAYPWQTVPPAGRVFTTTRWSVLQACGGVDPVLARQALEELCQSYWYPIYASVRHAGRTPEDARDLTQEFFAKILREGWLRQVDPSRGRFRFYLLAALRRFLCDQHRRRWTLRRGRGYQVLSLDLAAAESRFSLEPATTESPETIYEQKWAATVIRHALEQLGVELSAQGRTGLFECFQAAESGEPGAGFYEEAATRLGKTTGALHTALSRLRERLRTLVREEVARTVAQRTESEIDEEIRHLRRVVARPGAVGAAAW